MPWPPFAKARATTEQSLRPYQSPSVHGRDSNHVPPSRQSLKGRPETGGLAGGICFGSQVSAVRCLVRVIRFRYRFRKSALRPRSSPLPFRVAGGGPGWRVAGRIHSVLHLVLNAALHSALRDWFGPPSSALCPPSSIQPSIQPELPLCRDAVPTLPMAN